MHMYMYVHIYMIHKLFVGFHVGTHSRTRNSQKESMINKRMFRRSATTSPTPRSCTRPIL